MDDDAPDRRTLVLICYFLHLIGAVTGILSLVGLVLNYLKAGVSPPDIDTHHRWMIRTFWWAMMFGLFGGILYLTILMIPVALLLWFLIWLWYLYRHVKGPLALLDRRPMPL